ncbi:hypothetical protein C2E23DRAFT_524098 [Lenzites betulinus]|nr:hypothetical protein C2E23DRAFT_524098 [Lenzites betulinus]
MAPYDSSDLFASMPTTPAVDNDSLFDSYIDSSAYIDPSFCSNFSCCGQTIPDLHHLLDHFEEEHVLPFPQDNRPLYSSPVYARPAGPHASYILSYPQPDPPLHSSPLHISSAHGPLRALPDLAHVPELVRSPISTSSPSAPPSCFSSPDLAEPLCLPPALFTVQPARTRSPPARSHRRPRFAAKPLGDNDFDNHLTPSVARSGIGPHHSAKSHPRPDPIARSRPLPKTPAHAAAHTSGGRRRDGREKMFKCPVSTVNCICIRCDARSARVLPPFASLWAFVCHPFAYSAARSGICPVARAGLSCLLLELFERMLTYGLAFFHNRYQTDLSSTSITPISPAPIP